MSNLPETEMTAQPSYAYCQHGVAPYMVCGTCRLEALAHQREERLYAALEKFADAVDRLTEQLARD